MIIISTFVAGKIYHLKDPSIFFNCIFLRISLLFCESFNVAWFLFIINKNRQTLLVLWGVGYSWYRMTREYCHSIHNGHTLCVIHLYILHIYAYIFHFIFKFKNSSVAYIKKIINYSTEFNNNSYFYLIFVVYSTLNYVSNTHTIISIIFS